MKLNKGMKFVIGLFIDIGISSLLCLGPILTILFAILYIVFYIPDAVKFVRKVIRKIYRTTFNLEQL